MEPLTRSNIINTNGVRHLGYHILLDMSGVNPSTCEDDAFLLGILRNAAEKSGSAIINTVRYHFGHISPPGCSVFIMLDESHVSAHSYAEHGLIAFDIFVCGKTARQKADTIREMILKSVPCANVVQQEVCRFVKNDAEAAEQKYELHSIRERAGKRP